MANGSAAETAAKRNGLESRAKKLTDVVNRATGEFLIIIAQVDPDALGSALGLAAILRHVRNGPCHIRIGYSGKISHPQNRVMFNMCGLDRDVLPIQEIEPDQHTSFVLVDSNSLKDRRLPERYQTVMPTIVIDHHRGELPDESDQQMYIVEDIGSSSTIVTELIKITETAMTEQLALLLSAGIYTDTKGLLNCGERDRDAFGYLARHMDRGQFLALTNYDLPRAYYSAYSYALQHSSHKSNRLVANAGFLKPDEEDYLAIIVDELLRMEGVELAVVWGIVLSKEKRGITVKARSTNHGMDLKSFLQERFGKDSAGGKYAPGGRSEGGASVQLELGIWMSDGVRAELEALVSARFNELILED